MAIVRLRLLGGLKICNAAGDTIDLRVKKVMALLAYLAVHPETHFSRKLISQVFWPNTNSKQSRHSLRQGLADLRKHLPDVEQVFDVTHSEIRIIPDSISVDVIDFSDAAKSLNTTSQEKAYQLYQGPFIENFNIRSDTFNNWCEETRSVLHQRYIQVVEYLAEHNLLEGKTDQAIALNRKLVQLDPIRESAYRSLMSLHAKAGQLNAVEAEYTQCCNMLHQKLNTRPEEQTINWYLRIKQQLSEPNKPVESNKENEKSVSSISPALKYSTPTGRKKELLIIETSLKNFKQDQKGHCILVTGDVGIGKSWLLTQCREIAENIGLNTACSRFFDIKFNHENGIRDMLSEITKPEPALSNNELPKLIAHRFFNDSAKHDIYLAILYIIYDLPVPKQLQRTYSALSLNSREQLHTKVIVDIISRAAIQGKIVLVFDDIDLAMPRAFSILNSLIQLCASRELFLIVACKQATPFPELAGNDSHTTMMVLNKLAISELKQIFPLRWGKHNHDMVYLSWAARLDKRGISDYSSNLGSVLEHYINLLENQDQLVLQTCAVLGMRFSPEALKSVIDNPHFEPEKLIEAGFLILTGHVLEFSDLLTQQCIYSQIDKEQRKFLHSQAASYYLFGSSHLHAYHLHASGNKGATKAYISAAITARDEYRLDFATYFFEKAFECAADKQDKYFSAMQKGKMLLGSERVSNAIQSFELAQHLTSDPQQQAQAWLGMAVGLIQRQQFLAAKGLLDRCEAILAKNFDHKSLARFYYHRALTALHTDSIETALRFNKIALEHARQCQSSYWQTRTALLAGNIELDKLQLTDAYSSLEFAVRIARENNHGDLELKTILSLAKVKILQADFSGGIKDLEHVIHLASLIEDNQIMLDILSVLCISDFYKGQFNRLQQHTGLASELCNIIDIPLKQNHIDSYRLLALYQLGRQEDMKKLLAAIHLVLNHSPLNYSQQKQFQDNRSLKDQSQKHQFQKHQSWNLAPIMALIDDHPEDAALYLDNAIKVTAHLNGPDRLECCFISIEAAIKHKLWEHAENFADTIIMTLQDEHLPFFVMCAERVRILSRIDQGQISHTTRAELVDILTTAKQYGLTIHLPAYENALEMLRHGTETV